MASTILRFRNPSVFQIIDRHAYRTLYGTDCSLYTQSSAKRKAEVYFAYLDDLRLLCEGKGLSFESVDRVLYVFVKETNGGLAKTRTLNERRNCSQPPHCSGDPGSPTGFVSLLNFAVHAPALVSSEVKQREYPTNRGEVARTLF